MQRGGHGGLGEEEELTAIVVWTKLPWWVWAKKKKRTKKKKGDEADVRE